ncbi:hypothetical protein BJ170DRAFT_439910 [Xylariales sp. AK1849]|nr:hypothetical protein BJ170DRAFT_439910 [Xylariales sp. AK1849]
MAQVRMHIGTLRQRMSLLVVVVFLLTLTWNRWRHLYTQSTQSTSIITTPPQYHYPDLDLSSPRAPFISWPLARVCAETTFVPGLVFICDNNSGGPGNIRNYILTCLRYAIDAGSASLILPRIRSRSVDDLSNIFRKYAEFEYMFDESHFRAGMAAACPQITIYAEIGDVPHVMEKVAQEGLPDVEKMIELITPKSYGRRGGCDQRDQNRHTDRFGDSFRNWLNESAVERGFREIIEESPRLIRLQWGVLWDWVVMRDGPEFVATFGGLLRLRENVLALGEDVLRALQREAGAVPAREGRAKESFLGLHLRTEKDALEQWPSYDVQASGYMKEAERRGFRGGVVYLASGSETEAGRFADDAQSSLQIQVRTKYDILKGQELEALKSLSWDQQALVDFVVLLGADYFVGVSPSSFSINVALKRHLKTFGLHTRPWKVGGQGDGRSRIVGSYEQYWEDWLFMYDGMWP